MATVLDLLTGSLQDLNICGGGDTPDPNDVALAFSRLNDFVDDLKNDGLTVYTITRTTWTLVASTASYSIGSGGTVNIDRPITANAISNVGFVDTSVTPNLERLVGPPLTEDEYALLPLKALTAVYPEAFYYNPTYPLGAIKPFPIPTSSTLLGVIYAPAPVGEFTATSDTIALPPGYRRFFRNQLTIEIAGAFEKTPPPAVVKAADESLAKIKRTNTRPTDLAFDLALTPDLPAWDINAGP
jgi:hypothetical protein